MPAYIAPVTAPRLLSSLRRILLTQRRDAFDGGDWLFEPKWDGWRCIAAVRQGRTRLLSRNGNDLTARFPSVSDTLGQLPDGTLVDGELVVLDGDGPG